VACISHYLVRQQLEHHSISSSYCNFVSLRKLPLRSQQFRSDYSQGSSGKSHTKCLTHDVLCYPLLMELYIKTSDTDLILFAGVIGSVVLSMNNLQGRISWNKWDDAGKRVRGCIQKFPDWLKEIYAYNKKILVEKQQKGLWRQNSLDGLTK
jgi:hypothetical protein